MDPAQDSNEQMADESDDIALIREVLLGAEYGDLLELRTSLNDPAAFSQKISSVVSEALAQRIDSDESLGEVLTPTINLAIQNSITTDPDTFANSLYPVMGPAIRKSISEALSQLLESLNLLLEQNITLKTLRWRFQAWWTGRSYSEIVLMNTMEYQVEQIFLIHKETSLLIQHVVADLALSKDPDIVSSMLSAIQDYINDSFAVDENEHLTSMQLGDLTVLLKQGPYAVLAAVIRGNVPPELNNLFKEKLEEVHKQFGKQLLGYSGGANHFLALKPSLQKCLVSRSKQGVNRDRRPWAALIFVLALTGALTYYFYQKSEMSSWRRQAIDNLVAEPGIVVIDSEVQADGVLLVRGLRDLLSANPQQIAQVGLTDQLALDFQFDLYLSVEPDIVERRIINILHPPEAVSFTLDNGTLTVSGTANTDWVSQLNDHWSSVHGVEVLDSSNLISVDPIYEELIALQQTIENIEFSFEPAGADLIDSDGNLTVLADAIKRLLTLSQSRPYSLAIMVLGDADDTGTDGLNVRIAHQRADISIGLLTDMGIASGILQEAVLRDLPEFSDGLQERRVIFKVTGLPAQ